MLINVTQYLDKTANLYPEKTAVKDREKQLTFGEIKKQAQKLSRIIMQQGVINSPIAVYIQKGCDMVLSFAAICYSGNFYAPLDTKSPENRLKSIFDSLYPAIIITNNKYHTKLLSVFSGQIINIDELDIPINQDENFISKAVETIIDTDPVYSIFTSGSTGVPKGVLVTHRGVIDYIDWAIETFHITSETIIGNQAPFYFDNSTLDIYLMFATGATLIIIPETYYSMPAKLVEYLNQEKINFVFWVPSVLITLANQDVFSAVKPEFLEKILFAGEVMPNKHLNYWRMHLPGCLYANLYGPTEITVDCTYYIVDRTFTDNEPLPIGIHCRNTNVILLNERNQESAVNEEGEICVRGSCLALGYYNNQEKTANVFVQNPLNSHYPEIIYRTGDIAYRNERDEIIYVGRKDLQIKHSGYRIELGEIENAALGTGLVKSVCVVYDKVRKEIVLFYQATSNVDTNVLGKEMMKYIPQYMKPAKYIGLEEIPLNANGKIDRLLLSKQVNDVSNN